MRQFQGSISSAQTSVALSTDAGRKDENPADLESGQFQHSGLALRSPQT